MLTTPNDNAHLIDRKDLMGIPEWDRLDEETQMELADKMRPLYHDKRIKVQHACEVVGINHTVLYEKLIAESKYNFTPRRARNGLPSKAELVRTIAAQNAHAVEILTHSRRRESTAGPHSIPSDEELFQPELEIDEPLLVRHARVVEELPRPTPPVRRDEVFMPNMERLVQCLGMYPEIAGLIDAISLAAVKNSFLRAKIDIDATAADPVDVYVHASMRPFASR